VHCSGGRSACGTAQALIVRALPPGMDTSGPPVTAGF
jgi:hypothetical protein